MFSKQAVVWGATGFIGSHLVAALRGDGYAVTLATRSTGLPEGVPASQASHVWFDGSPASESSLSVAIAKSSVVFNLAGVSGAARSNLDPRGSLDGNCRIQLGFLNACERAGTCPHVVFASSRLVYGPVSELPVDEQAPIAPRSVYAAHKLCVEHYHQIAALRGKITFSICRISNPYGFFDQAPAKAYGFINSLIQRGCKKEPLTIYGDGEQIRDYIHIGDLSSALKLCGSEPGARNQIFNIGCGQGISVGAAAEEIQRLTGAPVLRVPWPAEDLFVESGDYVAGIQKARVLLGFQPKVQFHEGVQKLLASHVDAHMHRKDDASVLGVSEGAGAWV